MVSEKAPTENLVRTAACRMMLDMAVRANGPDSGLASFEALARGEDDLSLLSSPPCRLGSLARIQNAMG